MIFVICLPFIELAQTLISC